MISDYLERFKMKNLFYYFYFYRFGIKLVLSPFTIIIIIYKIEFLLNNASN